MPARQRLENCKQTRHFGTGKRYQSDTLSGGSSREWPVTPDELTCWRRRSTAKSSPCTLMLASPDTMGQSARMPGAKPLRRKRRYRCLHPGSRACLGQPAAPINVGRSFQKQAELIDQRYRRHQLVLRLLDCAIPDRIAGTDQPVQRRNVVPTAGKVHVLLGMLRHTFRRLYLEA